MKVVVLSGGFEERSIRLQPHRTLLEMGRQLAALGHDVVLVSDGGEAVDRAHGKGGAEELGGLRLRRVPCINLYRRKTNADLLQVIAEEAPDKVLWHLSLSSFLHQDFGHPFADRAIGVMTSPAFSIRQLIGLGWSKVQSNQTMIATHIAGSLVPGWLLRYAFNTGLRGVITLSDTTREFMIRRGAPANRLWTIPPGVDREWVEATLRPAEHARVRSELGLDGKRFIIAYFGSPAPVRGLQTALRAVKKAARQYPELAMVVLSRRHSDEWEKQAALLEELIGQDGLRERVRIVDGFLDQSQLIRYLLASDAVALPFEVVPSDMPLSIYEAMALCKSVVGTTVACIPEMLAGGRGFLVPPNSVPALTDQFKVLAGHPGLAEARGEAARAYVSAERRWEHMGQRLDTLLRRLNGNGR